ncbi:Uncharacterized protein TCM_004138 [Theobroma cacao]|uniref:Secreted protein n=1 Tax=Theobroma cacao TaxID=3641 RepID=A0A061DNY2_THECC|nr:Uncharacterized protein TCM_004138 [Theobroma cacao]
MKCLHLFVFVTAVNFLLSTHPCEASRLLNEDVLVLQSLQKGPVPPSGRNGCTNIPGRGGPPCTSHRAFAGHIMAPPRLQPDHMSLFRAAANLK